MAAWRGIVAPKGLPAPIRDKLAESVRKVAASKEYNEFMASRGFGVIYASPDDFAKFMVKSNSELGATMKAVGLVK
jgi:tripartite-type tricarboxylate transporter receptor subunit TctC